MHEMRATSTCEGQETVCEWHIIPRRGAVALCGRDMPWNVAAPTADDNAVERWCQPCLRAFEAAVAPAAS